jgi:predicted N-acetyltransferase YhbS
LKIEADGMRGLIVISSQRDIIATKSIRFDQIRKMPIVAVAWDTGNELVRLVGSQACLKVKWCDNPRKNESQNVVAVLPGTGPYWMAVTAHHDSAAYDPGALDNGGGSAMLVELAQCLAGKQFPATIYFVSTGSEENGGLDGCGAGSKAFYHDCKDKLDTCIAHVEIDDIGNILGIPQICFRGNKPFTDLLFDEQTRNNYQLTEWKTFGCDNGVAAKNGVPFVWFTDAVLHPRPWYHSPDDTKDKWSFDKCTFYFEYISRFIEKLANAKPFYPYIKENGLIIRPARYEDLEVAQEITKLAFAPVSTSRMEEDFFGEELNGTPWHVYKNREIQNQFSTNLNLTIICEKDGIVVGYATIIYDKEKKIAKIGNNAVHPDYQGQGIGKAMQREIARRMAEDGYTRFAVQTLTCDIAAQKIYEKLGYERIASNIFYLKK